MRNWIKKGVAALVLAGTVAGVAAPAQARWYGGRYYGYHHGGDDAGYAILGGLVGLGIGAAIASDHRDRYYDRGYYPPRYGYYDAPRYGYDGYYARPYRPYYRQCVVRREWDGYRGGWVRIRSCY